jgi:hypothetical protein
LKIPGRVAAFILAIVAIVTVIFPVVTLPCSITGFIQARSARKFIKQKGLKQDTLTLVAYYLNLLALLAAVAIIAIAIPGAVQRNLVR